MLRWGIGSVLHSATPAAADLPSSYLRFAERLRPGDCVVTFNYDRILEIALDTAGTPYRRFPMRYIACYDMHSEVDSERDAQEVLVLKVHGSVNWVDRTNSSTTCVSLPARVALPILGDATWSLVTRRSRAAIL